MTLQLFGSGSASNQGMIQMDLPTLPLSSGKFGRSYIYIYSKRSMWKSLAFILHSIIFICHPFAKSSVIREACRNHLENRRKQILFMQERLEEWGATKKPWNCAVSTYTRAIPSQHKTPVPQSPAVWNDLRWDAMDRGILSSQIARCPVFKSHCWAPKKIRPDTISYYYKVYHSNSISEVVVW